MRNLWLKPIQRALMDGQMAVLSMQRGEIDEETLWRRMDEMANRVAHVLTERPEPVSCVMPDAGVGLS